MVLTKYTHPTASERKLPWKSIWFLSFQPERVKRSKLSHNVHICLSQTDLSAIHEQKGLISINCFEESYCWEFTSASLPSSLQVISCPSLWYAILSSIHYNKHEKWSRKKRGKEQIRSNYRLLNHMIIPEPNNKTWIRRISFLAIQPSNLVNA